MVFCRWFTNIISVSNHFVYPHFWGICIASSLQILQENKLYDCIVMAFIYKFRYIIIDSIKVTTSRRDWKVCGIIIPNILQNSTTTMMHDFSKTLSLIKINQYYSKFNIRKETAIKFHETKKCFKELGNVTVMYKSKLSQWISITEIA